MRSNLLLALAALGFSCNVAATSIGTTENHLKPKDEVNVQKKEVKKNQSQKKKTTKHKHKHKHHKKHHHHHPKHHYYNDYPQYQQYPYSEQGLVREAEPRVPGDNSGKKMEMDEYR